MDIKFSELLSKPDMLKAIEEMGFESPTKVQEASIPLILNGKDLIVKSKTGSGKTAAFGLPILELLDEDVKEPQVLVLSPTRELAVQVDNEFKLMSKYMKLKNAVVYGQHNIQTEISELEAGAIVITGTPGRVFDHIERKTLKLDKVRFLVLDEGDRMLDMGFYDQIIKIIKVLPKERQTMLFSATMPFEIQNICLSYMKDPETIEFESDTKTVDLIDQVYYRVERNEKRKQLCRVLKAEQPDSSIVFCNTRAEVDRVVKHLLREGFHAEGIHGAMSQNKRLKTIQKLKKNNIQVLVATDVAARGIHVDELSLVINYDIPVELDSYVHRIGRTGRAGNEGKAISLITGDDIMSLYEVEEHIGALIEEKELPTEAYLEEQIAGSTTKWSTMKPPKVPHTQHSTRVGTEHKRSSKNSNNRYRQDKRTGSASNKPRSVQVGHQHDSYINKEDITNLNKSNPTIKVKVVRNGKVVTPSAKKDPDIIRASMPKKKGFFAKVKSIFASK